VVVSSPSCAEASFTEHDVAFANRPRLPSQELASFGGAALAVSSYGPYWRTLRRVAAVRLLSTHRVACSMCPIISAEVRAMLLRVSRTAEASGRVQLKDSLFELSLSVLMETIAQTKTSRTDTDDGEGRLMLPFGMGKSRMPRGYARAADRRPRAHHASPVLPLGQDRWRRDRRDRERRAHHAPGRPVGGHLQASSSHASCSSSAPLIDPCAEHFHPYYLFGVWQYVRLTDSARASSSK